ncbi:LysR family transcriptional regulator [Rosenbergiella sp. S61]|uniref:LysR family transcriptional regulator n=1 Tax=Rosenbergiella gaditana TaxID=2726987 RepID=A0ABS5SXZ3_9GAMM|nr:LysR family transcriptional regulator [Rosenbergiella gaditana]MBT0724881.1 LysR family transcriptional regulator [Rosenbergiella gaditana]
MKNWEDIRFFLAVADSGSLSGAARTLNVDHATVSRRINSLEKSLSSKLIIRNTRSCSVTPLGERVIIAAKQMENASFAIDRLALSAQHTVAGKVSISAPPVLVTHILAKYLNTFYQRYPEIHLHIVSSATLASLSKQEADIILRLARPNDNNDVSRKLGNIPFAFYASNDYTHKDNPKRWNFIGYNDDFAKMPHAKWITSIAGNRPIVCSLSDITSQIEAVKTGVGIGSIPRFIGDDDSKLVRLACSEDVYSPEVWLAVHADMRTSPVLRIVLNFLTETINQHILSS